MDDCQKWYGCPGYPDLDRDELLVAIAAVGNPPTITISELPDQASPIVKRLKSKAGRRSVTRIFWRAGYEVCKNPHNKEGFWRINGKNVRIYKKRDPNF